VPLQSTPFESIKELAAALRSEDPPVPKLLPGDLEFVRVRGEHGGCKIIPSTDRLQFLYRGQNRRWTPCVPSVYRGAHNDKERLRLNFLLSRVRIAEFELLLQQHPLVQYALQEKVELDYDALAQHYGLPTYWLDVTSNIEVACFFAVARFDASGSFEPCGDGTGVIYRVHWRDIEERRRYFTSISHSPASRPGRQHAWAVGMNGAIDFDRAEFVEPLEFRHSRSESEQIIAALGARLYPHDSIADVASVLRTNPGITMAGIRAGLKRDGCPAEQLERIAAQSGEAMCNGLGLDVYLDEEFALTEEQMRAGESEAATLREAFGSEIGFRLERTRKPQ
jgi:hypothetical protein